MIEEKKYLDCAGYVYVLSNPSMPDIVKIGRSKHGGRVRAKNIYQGITGVPTPFFMEFELWSNDCIALEAAVHDELSNERVSDSREFFRIDISEAIKSVMSIFAYDFSLTIQSDGHCIDEQDLLSMCLDHKEINKIISNDFNDMPASLVLSTAIRTEIKTHHLVDILANYKQSCIRRSNDIAKSRSGKNVLPLKAAS